MQKSGSPKSSPGPWSLRRGAKQSDGEWYSRGYLPHRDSAALIQHVTVHLADSLPREAVEKIDLSIRLLPEGQRRNVRRERLHDLIDAGHGSCVLRIPAVADMVQDTLLFFHDVRYSLHAWVVMPNHFHVLFETLNEWTMGKIVSSWKKFSARRIRDYLRNNVSSEEAFTNANREIGDPHMAETLEAGHTNANQEIGVPRMAETSEEGRINANQEIGVPHRADCPEVIVTSSDHEVGIQESVPHRAAILRPVWHREFRDRYIRDEKHYWDTVEYIHNNPVKAGLVKSPEAWPWSGAGRGCNPFSDKES